MVMSLFKPKKDEYTRELERLKAARVTLDEQDAEDRRLLLDLRAQLASASLTAILNGKKQQRPGFPNAAEIANDAAAVRTQIRAVEDRIADRAVARPGLLEAIGKAIKAQAHMKAEGIRQDAAKLRDELAAHTARSAELLTSLENHAGIRYAPVFREPPPGVTAFIEAELPFKQPRSAFMQARINALLAEAQTIEQQAEQACQS